MGWSILCDGDLGERVQPGAPYSLECSTDNPSGDVRDGNLESGDYVLNLQGHH